MDENRINQHLANLTGMPVLQDSGMIQVNDSYVSPDQAAGLGLMMSAQYMAKNGPMQPPKLGVEKMTKAQLKKQEEREAMGLPSSEMEAARVVALEQKVEGIESGISAILNKLNGGTGPSPQATPTLQYIPPVSTPTYPAPAASPQFGRETDPTLPFGGRGPQAPSFQQQSIDSEPPSGRVVTLQDGRKVVVGKRSTPQIPPAPTALDDPFVVVPEDESVIDPSIWVEEANEPEEIKNDPRLERLAEVSAGVSRWLRSKDPLLFWKRVIPRTLGRHMGYDGWSPALKTQFNAEFTRLLSDPLFIQNSVGKILGFEYGYAISEERIAGMVVLCAGFAAFMLSGV